MASILGGERRTQREVAEVAGVTEVTILNCYQELAERLDINIVLGGARDAPARVRPFIRRARSLPLRNRRRT